MGLTKTDAVAREIGGKITQADNVILVVPQPTHENHRMTASGRAAVAQKISGPRVLEVGYGITQAITHDRALFGIARAFDVPELQGVEEVVKGQARFGYCAVASHAQKPQR